MSYRSDNSPVLLVLKFINQTKGWGTWKFNDSLLHDGVFIKRVKSDIKSVIEDYECDSQVELEREY